MLFLPPIRIVAGSKGSAPGQRKRGRVGAASGAGYARFDGRRVTHRLEKLRKRRMELPDQIHDEYGDLAGARPPETRELQSHSDEASGLGSSNEVRACASTAATRSTTRGSPPLRMRRAAWRARSNTSGTPRAHSGGARVQRAGRQQSLSDDDKCVTAAGRRVTESVARRHRTRSPRPQTSSSCGRCLRRLFHTAARSLPRSDD
ncbi:hypothetical protein OKW49_006904 [Paraburkholderia youngii]